MITKNDGRQNLGVAFVDVTYEDLLGESGNALDAIEVPGGAIVVGGFIAVLTAFNSGTSDALDFGDAADDDRYLAAVNLQSTGVTELTLTGYEHTALEQLQALWTGVGAAPSAGKFRIVVMYIDTGKAEWTQG